MLVASAVKDAAPRQVLQGDDKAAQTAPETATVVADASKHDGMRNLVIQKPYPALAVRQYIKNHANTVKELQICSVDASYMDVFDIRNHFWRKCNHQHYCPYDSDDEHEGHEPCLHHQRDGPVHLPKMKKFKAVANNPASTIADENIEKIWDSTSKYSLGLKAPNLEEIIYEGDFIGFDHMLFNSCARNLKVVRFEINSLSIISIYKAIAWLSSCENLTIKTSYQVFTLWNDQTIDHPFGGDYTSLLKTPAKSLIKVKELCFINDMWTSGQDLIRFVMNKKNSAKATSLDKLTIDNCRLVKQEDVVILKTMVPDVSYQARVTKEESLIDRVMTIVNRQAAK